MQKELNVINLLLIIFLLNTFNISAQNKINGTYYKTDGTGYFFENYIFFNSNIFSYEEGGDLGVNHYGKGHYEINKDSLILNFDLTELIIKDYHKYKYYKNNNDYITVRVNLYDLNNVPIKNQRLSIISKNLFFDSDVNGQLIFKLNKEKKLIKLSISNNFLGYDIKIWADRNYEIDVYLNLDNYGTAIKNQILKYKILEQTDDFIKLKNYNNVLKLIKQSE